jgi:hypothetical protein
MQAFVRAIHGSLMMVAVVATAPSVAGAQAVSPEDTAGRAETGFVEEVVITARRREESALRRGATESRRSGRLRPAGEEPGSDGDGDRRQ